MSSEMEALLAKLHDAEQARRQTEQECHHERQARSELEEQLQKERALGERGAADSAVQRSRWERIEAVAVALLRQL